MSYLNLAKRAEQKLEQREVPLPQSLVTTLSSKDQAILNVKMVFPGTKVLSEAVAKELLPKLKLAEWEEIDSAKEGVHE